MDIKLKPRHPMRVVSMGTGLGPDLVRVWEKRYGAVVPHRTDSNHRLYSDADIERLRLLRRALDAGWQIGQVASLDNEEILEMLAGHAQHPAGVRGASRRGHAERFVVAGLEAVAELDGPDLRRHLDEASVELSSIDLMDLVLVPLIERIGNGCREGWLRTANEHLSTVVVRTFLDSMDSAYPPAADAPAIVVTTPRFQHHELGALLVAATARTEAWQATYLGPNLPAEEIAAAASIRNADHVALSITYPEGDEKVDGELQRLRALLPEETTVLVGGRSAIAYIETLREIEAVYLENLPELRRFLANQGPASRSQSDADCRDEQKTGRDLEGGP